MNSSIQEMMDLLEKGLASINDSKDYQNYLRVMARFPRYSMRNTMLIYTQMPDATLVAGYSTWKNAFHRHVRKGEKGIRIFAPYSYVKKEQDEKTGQMIKKTLKGFRPVFVFDYSQTEGKPLPDPYKPVMLEGELANLESLTGALEDLSGYQILFLPMDEDVKGTCSYEKKLIKVSESLSPLHAFKTILHETAHALLHSPAARRISEHSDYLEDRSLREVEAESVSFVVCQVLGIDCSDYSLPYVASWNNGRKLLSLTLERIAQCSSTILEALENRGFFDREAPGVLLKTTFQNTQSAYL